MNLRKPRIPNCLQHCHVCSDHFELRCFGRDLKVTSKTSSAFSSVYIVFVLLRTFVFKLINLNLLH